MRPGTIASAALVAVLAAASALAACTSSAPHLFGQYNDLAPKVAATKGERVPQHITIQLAKPAYVAVFLVVPGRGSVLLFPDDSLNNGHMDAGAHQVETSVARQAFSDSSILIRRAPPPGNRTGARGRGGYGGTGRDSLGALTFNQHGYLLIYASPEPLPYSILSTRVAGLSIPIDDDDALNTVTKLIRERTHTTGTWAAYATDFPP